MEPVVRKIDHMVITSDAADQLFKLMAETLRFPVVWPLFDFDGYISGGICVGNTNIEINQSRSVGQNTPNIQAAKMSGIVFEPVVLQACMAELERRAISHTQPWSYTGSAPSTFSIAANRSADTHLWKVINLPAIQDGGFVALCEYNRDLVASIEPFAQELQQRAGGPLGVEAMQEVIVGTLALPTASGIWQHLLNPIAPQEDGYWLLGNGPALRLVAAQHNAIQTIVLEVTSLKQAHTALSNHGMLGTVTARNITIAPEYVQGLDIQLVE